VNEQTGAIVTRGLIELQYKVMPPLVGVKYPFTGFTLIVPCALLPAGTLLGATASTTVMVNSGVTANTVNCCGGAVKVVVGPVAVIVTL
jgi:hypothetical protein